MRTEYRYVVADDIISTGSEPVIYCENAIINFTGQDNFNRNHDLVIKGVLSVGSIETGHKYNYLKYLKRVLNKL